MDTAFNHHRSWAYFNQCADFLVQRYQDHSGEGGGSLLLMGKMICSSKMDSQTNFSVAASHSAVRDFSFRGGALLNLHLKTSRHMDQHGKVHVARWSCHLSGPSSLNMGKSESPGALSSAFAAALGSAYIPPIGTSAALPLGPSSGQTTLNYSGGAGMLLAQHADLIDEFVHTQIQRYFHPFSPVCSKK